MTGETGTLEDKKSAETAAEANKVIKKEKAVVSCCREIKRHGDKEC